MKVAFVIHRFSRDIAGGSEKLALKFAESNASSWDITVLTTTSKDYLKWDNYYPVGEDSSFYDLKVIRFPVERERDFDAFSQTSWERGVTNYSLSKEEERKYFEDQGPYVPKLKDYVEDHRDDFDCFIFFTYLYYTTAVVIQSVLDKSYLFPTAHDEPPFYFMRTFSPIFKGLKGIFYLSDAELNHIASTYKIPSRVKKIHIRIPLQSYSALNNEDVYHCEEKFSPLIGRDYFLFVGRATIAKNILDLIHCFVEMKKKYPEDRSLLVFAGSMEVDWKQHRDILNFGYVSEIEKQWLLTSSRVVINPSLQESLSIIIFESWLAGTPVLVNGRCPATRDLCGKAKGGLYYHSLSMFQTLLKWFLDHPHRGRYLGKLGHKYVSSHYLNDSALKVSDL